MKDESGNVLFLILIAVALFAALQYAMTRGSQNNMTGDRERNSLAADQIIRYGQGLRRGVELIRNAGYSENLLSFDHPDLTGYNNASALSETEVFSLQGGGVTYETPKSSWQTTQTDWYFSGETCVVRVADYDVDCHTDGEPELIAFLPNIRLDVCRSINDHGGVFMLNDAPPVDDGDAWTGAAFAGTFADGERIGEDGSNVPNALAGREFGCFEGGGAPAGGTYTFYQVLMAR